MFRAAASSCFKNEEEKRKQFGGSLKLAPNGGQACCLLPLEVARKILKTLTTATKTIERKPMKICRTTPFNTSQKVKRFFVQPNQSMAMMMM